MLQTLITMVAMPPLVVPLMMFASQMQTIIGGIPSMIMGAVRPRTNLSRKALSVVR